MVFYKAVIRVSVGATVMSRFSWGRICFQAHFGCWKDWFLMGSWTEGFDSLLADGQRLPSVPFQMALSIKASMKEDPRREKPAR